MKGLAMPVSPYPTFLRKREKGRTRNMVLTLTIALPAQASDSGNGNKWLPGFDLGNIL